MNKRRSVKTRRNEKGFVLITSLMILVVLTLIGIAATRNTSIELQIAGNDRLVKETFYAAEADDILGTEVLEQSFACPTGFQQDGALAADPTEKTVAGKYGTTYADILATIRVFNRRMDRKVAFPVPSTAMNQLAIHRNTNLDKRNFNPTDSAYYIGNITEVDVAYPVSNIDSGEDVSYLYISGQIKMLPGGALQMAAGYEGKGKGAGGGGVGKIMDIYSSAEGAANSRAYVAQGWRHLVGTEGDCYY